ncbi:MAG: virulence factor [Nostocoides sp.]
MSNGPEFQVTYWRELPSMVVVRHGDTVGDPVQKKTLAPRFQETIDEAAMRLGEVDSEAYLEGWRRGDWAPIDGGEADGAVERLVTELEGQWDDARLTAYLDALGPAAG